MFKNLITPLTTLIILTILCIPTAILNAELIQSKATIETLNTTTLNAGTLSATTVNGVTLPSTGSTTITTTGSVSSSLYSYAVYGNISGAVTTTLHSAALLEDQEVLLKKTAIGTDIWTIEFDGSETADGKTSIAFSSRYDFIRLRARSGNWSVVDWYIKDILSDGGASFSFGDATDSQLTTITIPSGEYILYYGAKIFVQSMTNVTRVQPGVRVKIVAGSTLDSSIEDIYFSTSTDVGTASVITDLHPYTAASSLVLEVVAYVDSTGGSPVHNAVGGHILAKRTGL